GKLHLMTVTLRVFDPITQLVNHRMMAQLHDREHPPPAIHLDPAQLVEFFHARRQWFLTDHIAAKIEAGGDMRTMQMIRRADHQIVQRLAMTPEPPGVLEKTLELG